MTQTFVNLQTVALATAKQKRSEEQCRVKTQLFCSICSVISEFLQVGHANKHMNLFSYIDYHIHHCKGIIELTIDQAPIWPCSSVAV